MIDAHLHLDHYKDDEISQLMETIPQLDWLISVSFDLDLCKRNLKLTRKYQKVRPAFGYHPEQSLPTEISVE
ncbi:TatD family hydrolase [Neobacillus drentensis]|uniref:TatD family hydrolase n=1 Tax=Neobacillus drentensis TaxID=220684 RepID=UPI00300256F7